METQDYLIVTALTSTGTIVILAMVAYRQALARKLRAFAVSLSRGLPSIFEGLSAVRPGRWSWRPSRWLWWLRP